MNITFLIGNGFDIGLGLKTGYKSFYKEYCKLSGHENDNIRRFKTMLLKWQEDEATSLIDWSDFEKAFGIHSNDYILDEKQDYIERFEDFVSAFNEYLEEEEKRADFEQRDRIAKTMKNATTTYFHIREEDKEAIQRIYNTTNGARIYNFVSFNYTKTIDRCAEILKQYLQSDNQRDVGKVLHIHGYIEENMIMGVNDSSQIPNPLFSDDPEIIEEIVKPVQNAGVRANYENQLIQLINVSDIICIYGMSIGATDKKWWKTIALWLAKNERHALVILKRNRAYNKRLPFKQIKPITAVVNSFLELSEQPDDIKERIRSRVYVGINHNVFEMNLCRKPKDHYETMVEVAESTAKRIAELEESGVLKAFTGN